jgi:hypothetical protein
MIVHSFPKVPATLYPENNDWYNAANYNPKIFTNGTDGQQPGSPADEEDSDEDPDDGDIGETRNPFKYSQHAYCFNICKLNSLLFNDKPKLILLR